MFDFSRRLVWYVAVVFVTLVGTAGAATASGQVPSGEPPPPRPNILWLVAEDLSPYIPPFGDPTVETPTLSRLATEGVRYTRMFSPSGVCAPSRAAIATGMYPTHIGANNMRTGGTNLPPEIEPYEAVPPPDVKMFSEHLRSVGYYTSNRAKEDYQFRKTVTAWDASGPEAHWRNRAPGQPFFSVFNFGVTHESQIWVKADDPLLVADDLDVPVPPYLPDTEVGRRDVRRMYSNVREMDAQVGEILDQLEADGLVDETIVFWDSDHGGPLPRQKRLLYDSGMLVPMIVRFPDGSRAGETDDCLLSFIDFAPTVLSLAGIEPPRHLDGYAFLGPHAGATARRYVHGAADRLDQIYDGIRAVRNERFKYLRNLMPQRGYYLPVAYREQMPIMQELLRLRDAGELTALQAQWFRDSKPDEELFDTEADPHELNNLATDPAYARVLEELRGECDRWMEAIDDPGSLPETELRERLWPGGRQPVTARPEFDPQGSTVAIRSATVGASIGYQILTTAEVEGAVWQIYTTAVTLDPGDRIVAVAHRLGYEPSEQVEWLAR